MSCDWNIYCTDCQVSGGINSEANRMMELMVDLADNADAIASLDPLSVSEGRPAGSGWDIELKVGWVSVNVRFFVEHKGHKLRPRNEYGEFDTPCGKDGVCEKGCGTVKCSRGEGHHANCWHHVDEPYAIHWCVE